MITIVIVDDHPVVRAGLRMALAAADDLSLVAEGATAADALRLVAQHRPDVLVLDVNLPDMNGVEVTRQLAAQPAMPAILALTALGDRETVFGLLEAGATGYVLKDEALETLADAVRAVARGESWLSPTVARQVLRRAVGQPAGAAPAQPKAAAGPAEPSPLLLTPREVEVLCLLAQGLDNTAIARRLVLTTRTVQNHVSNIYGKLEVASRTEAALLAIRAGLVEVSCEEAA
jgi:DNA-binding NarL/FixJ family response regulator